MHETITFHIGTGMTLYIVATLAAIYLLSVYLGVLKDEDAPWYTPILYGWLLGLLWPLLILFIVCYAIKEIAGDVHERTIRKRRNSLEQGS